RRCGRPPPGTRVREGDRGQGEGAPHQPGERRCRPVDRGGPPVPGSELDAGGPARDQPFGESPEGPPLHGGHHARARVGARRWRCRMSDAVITPAGPALDPLGDADRADEAQIKRNRAKVGSARPTSLLYTYGPGAIMDLPQFTVMPAGLDDWDRIWARRDQAQNIHAPRLLQSVRKVLGYDVRELRPFPWAPKRSF